MFIITIPIQIGISAIPTQDIGIVLIVIALVLTLRVYRGMKGMKYSPGQVYSAPLIYFILLLVGLADLNPSYTDIIAVVLTLILGYFVGRKLAGGVRFFDKDGAIYYKRSPIILVIWLVSFIVRFGLDYITIPGITYLAIAVEVVLALTTGMIAGEAHHINISYKEYAGNKGMTK